MSLEEVIAASIAARELGLSYGKYTALSYNPEKPKEAPPPRAKRRRGRRYTDEQAFSLWQEGRSDKEIAEDCGVSRQCIQKWRDQLELPLNGKDINTKKYRLDYLQDGTAIVISGDDI